MKLRNKEINQNVVIERRGSRFYQTPRGWFFNTREGNIQGPYIDKESAKEGLNDYLAFVSNASSTALEQFFGRYNISCKGNLLNQNEVIEKCWL